MYHLFSVDFTKKCDSIKIVMKNKNKKQRIIFWKTHFEYGSNTPELTLFARIYIYLTKICRFEIFLGSIPASSDTVESEGRQMRKC